MLLWDYRIVAIAPFAEEDDIFHLPFFNALCEHKITAGTQQVYISRSEKEGQLTSPPIHQNSLGSIRGLGNKG